MRRIAVVGAGLSGLTAGIYLSRQNLEVTLYEASDRVGGRVTTDYIDGYICDRGFQVINPSYPEIRRLNGLKDLEFSPISPNVRVDGIPYGISHPINILRALPDLKRKVINPFLKGVFLTEPKKINPKAANEIMRSFIVGRPGVPKLGVAKFTENLAKTAGTIKLGATVDSVGKGTVSGNFGNEKFDAVIIATDPATATYLTGVKKYQKLLQSFTWYYSVKNEIPNSKYLSIDSKGKLVSSVVMSNVSSAYAPNGYSLISATSLNPLGENELKKELENLWDISTRDWELINRYEIKESLPFREDCEKLNPKIGEFLYLAGDHMDIPSQNGAMRSGRRAAAALIADLKLN